MVVESRATDVRVLDLLPAGLTFVSATPSQGIYSATAVVGPPAYAAGTWRVGTLNNGAVATLTINAGVTGTTPITNWAQVSYVDQFDPDSTPGSVVPPAVAQDDQASVTITPSPDLRVVKTATSSFAVGTNATYSITVNNTSPRSEQRLLRRLHDAYIYAGMDGGKGTATASLGDAGNPSDSRA